jgi:uncharacterized membrane protein
MDINFIIKNLKKVIFLISIFFFFFYISIFFLAFTPFFYNINFFILDTDSNIDTNLLNQQRDNLISYFWYKNELNTLWSEKEKIHYKEVRDIYNYLHLLFILSIFLIIFFKDKVFLKNNIKYIIFFYIFPILLIPVFSYFWNNIFHKLLFYNNYWMFDYNEISYTIFSLQNYNFFLLFYVYLIIFNVSSLLLLYYFLKLENKQL